MREGRAQTTHALEATARAVTAEAGLVARVAQPQGSARNTPTIRIVFDAPPKHLTVESGESSVSFRHTPADTLSDAQAPAQHSLTDGGATDYAIIERDELDD